ncbi:13368_t:CDS:1, partial [Funneliformis caledonium]
NPEIERYFKTVKFVPNKSLTTFVKVNQLYDMDNFLFRNIFAGSDKFLPPNLQNNATSLEALTRIGLKSQINGDTFIECAQEVESQIIQNRFSISLIKIRAKELILYMYEHIETLDFDDEQLEQILDIKFVLSDKNLPVQFYQSPKETSGFETFGNICRQEYKKICWTQCPIFDKSIEPTALFNEYYPEIGIPCTESIINHWFFVAENIESWKSSKNEKKIKSVIKNIYESMIERSDESDLIESNISDPKKKLFLNDENPFDKNNCVAGKELIIGDDFKGVKEFLMPYEELLFLAGA